MVSNILLTWESFIAISKNKGARIPRRSSFATSRDRQGSESREAHGSRLRAQGKNFVFYYLLPYALSKFAIRNVFHALCFSATDN